MANTLVPIDDTAEAPQQNTLVPVAEPDKYQQAAIDERAKLKAAGVPLQEGYGRRFYQGPMMGWADEITAGAMTPLEMIKRGTLDPREAYRYAKAREDLTDQMAQQNTGALGTGVEIGSALATLPAQVIARPVAAAIGGARPGVMGALARMAGYGTEGAVMGGVSGAGTAPTMADIPEEAARGAKWGFAFGAPFGAAANVAPRTAAAIPTEAELTRSGRFAYKTRDALPVGYTAQGVGDRLSDIADTYGRRYGQQGTPLTTETLRRKAGEAYSDVAAANAANIPPGSVKAPGTYSGAPNAGEATLRPVDVAQLRRDIYEQGSGKVSFDAAGRPVRNTIPAGSPTDDMAATVAARLAGRIISQPDPRLLSRGTNLRDAIAASLYDTRGRGDFAGAYRSKAVTDAMEDALKGGNKPFAERLRDSINKASESGEYSPRTQAELDNLERMIRGASLANALSTAGRNMSVNSLPGLALAAGAGGASYGANRDPYTAGAAALATLAAGRGLRAVGDRAAMARAERYAATLRQRTPLYEQRVMMAPMEAGPGLPAPVSGIRTAVTATDPIRDALARMLVYQTTGERTDGP